MEDTLQWKTTFVESLHAAYSAMRHFFQYICQKIFGKYNPTIYSYLHSMLLESLIDCLVLWVLDAGGCQVGVQLRKGVQYLLVRLEYAARSKMYYTSLAAPGALAHRLQRRTACNTSPLA